MFLKRNFFAETKKQIMSEDDAGIRGSNVNAGSIPFSVMDAFADIGDDIDQNPKPEEAPKNNPITNVFNDVPFRDERTTLVKKDQFDWKGTLLWASVGALFSAILTGVIAALAQPNLFKSSSKNKQSSGNKAKDEFDANNGNVEAMFPLQKLNWVSVLETMGIVAGVSFGASFLLSYIVYISQRPKKIKDDK